MNQLNLHFQYAKHHLQKNFWNSSRRILNLSNDEVSMQL